MNDNSIKEHLTILQAETERRRKVRKQGDVSQADTGREAAPPHDQRKHRRASHAIKVLKAKVDSGDYVRLIRDGHADRVHEVIRSALREIEVGKKTDRYSATALQLANEFEELAKEFPRKKELLSRVEERIGPMRKLMSGRFDVGAIQETLGHDRQTAEKLMRLLDDTSNLRDELIETASRLMELQDQIDEQTRADDREENELRRRISEHLEHFSAQMRIRFEVSMERSLRGARRQQRLDSLRKFEQQLAENTPEGRARRKAELVPQGRDLLEQRDFAGAAETLETAYQLDQTDEEVLLLLADAYKACGRIESAIKVLSRFVKEEESVPVYLCLANFLEETHRFDEALNVYGRALDMRPEEVSIHVSYARCLNRSGRAEEAYERLSELHARHPENTEVAIAFAESCDVTRRGLRARETLQEVTRSHPDNADAWDALGNHFWQSRDLDEAKKAYERVLQTDPRRFEATLRLADLARQAGEFSEAVARYRKALDIDETSPDAHIGLGIALRETQAVDKAISELERAVELGAEGGEVYHHLGLSYLASGDPRRASAAMQKAVSLGYRAA